jgi:hypothetical protein
LNGFREYGQVKSVNSTAIQHSQTANLKQYRRIDGKWQFVLVGRGEDGKPDQRLDHLNPWKQPRTDEAANNNRGRARQIQHLYRAAAIAQVPFS